MLKLIKLEWKKNHMKRYSRNALLLASLLGLFLFALAFLGIANDPETGIPDTVPGLSGISAPIELFTSMSFLVFTSVMLASFIVSAYSNRTMQLMFSYPIKRQKILVSQMLAVWIFSFVALTLTKLLLYGWILAGSHFRDSAFLIDFTMTEPGFYIQLLLKSGVIVTMSFMALFVGLILHSSKAVLVTSFLLILLTQGNIGDFTLRNQVMFPLLLTLLSLVFAGLSVYRVEEKDLM